MTTREPPQIYKIADFNLDLRCEFSVSSILMKSRRLLLIARIRLLTSVPLLAILLVLSGGAFALADGLAELNAQTLSEMQSGESTQGDAASGEDCPVCPHSHQSDTDNSCSCCHFQTSTEQTFSLNYAPLTAKQVFIEPVSSLPEVYFDRFIPPQLA